MSIGKRYFFKMYFSLSKTLLGIIAGMLCLVIQPTLAVTGVNPNGVNVNHTGVTTVFLTFQNLGANEQALESFWCGEVVSTGVSNFNPCVPGTLFGSLPQRNNLSRTSGTGGVSNLTDIMTIPAAVTRKAVQAARNGGGSFFYVRRFNDGISDTYITVTCRLAGGGARSPLSLTDVKIAFDTPAGMQPVYFMPRESTLPPVKTTIRYNGTGQLKGRWEVMLPGDPEPTELDLLTEATLPIEQRVNQRRYTLVSRFDVFLPPTGEAEIPSPVVDLIPTAIDGPYKLLLRIEASAEKEGNTNTVNGVVNTGGVAGFPMPVLRYFIGSGEVMQTFQNQANGNSINLITPYANVPQAATAPVVFSWQPIADATLYELAVLSGGEMVVSALVKSTSTQYTAPPWLSDYQGQELLWQVKGLAVGGDTLAASELRPLVLE